MWTVSPPFILSNTSQEHISRLKTVGYDTVVTIDTVTQSHSPRFNAVTFTVTLKNAVIRMRSYCNGY